VLIFIVVIVVYLCCVFFIGVFWWFCEVNWFVGVILLLLGLVNGFVGYLLFDDLFLGIGLCIVLVVVLLIFVVGIWL